MHHIMEMKKLLKYLIEHGANVNQKNEKGSTPLCLACYNGNENIVKYLVKHGANINQRNDDLYTPLTITCSEIYY